MIEKVTLHNFKTYDDAEIEFTEGINVITGKSSVGKSTILRAIDWVYSNSGDDIVSFWNQDKKGNPKGETSVEMVVNRTAIKRIKDSKRNGYDALGIEFGAIGRGVPDKVQNAMNLCDINFNFQNAPKFMVSALAGNPAKVFNSVLNMELIDKSLANAETDKRRLVHEIDRNTQELELLEMDNKFDYLDKVAPLIELYEKVSNKLEEFNRHRNRLNSLITEYETIQSTYINRKAKLEALQPLIHQLNDIVIQIKDTEARKKTLQGYIDTYEQLSKNVERYSRLKPVIAMIDEYKRIHGEVEDVKKKKDGLQKLVSSLLECRKRFSDNLDRLEILKKSMPDLCPLCGGKIGGNHDSMC